MPRNGMRPVHPGEILREDFLVPMHMSPNALAKHLKVTPARINEIVREERGITVDTALRLVAFFGGNAQTWLNLQQAYDLKLAEKAVWKTIRKDIKPLAKMDLASAQPA
jgi:antitoxin HigA-1